MTTEYEGLPPAVRRKVQEADRKIEDIKRSETATAVAEPPDVVVPPASSPSTQEPAPAHEPIAQDPASTEPTEATPTRTEPTLSDEDEKKIQRMEQANPRADWKDRYRTLLGKFNAEIPRLNALVRERDEFITQLQARVAQLETHSTPAQGTSPAPGNTPSVDQYVTEDDVRIFGPEFAEQQKRMAAKILADVSAQVSKANASATQAREDILRMKQDQFFIDLTRLVPNWNEINTDQKFLQWLNTPCQVQTQQGIQTVTRQQWLNSCHQRLDVVNVAEVFQRFIEEAGGTATGQNPPASSVPSLESQVVPPRAKGTTQTFAQRPMVKTSEYKAFLEEVAKGRWNSRPVERERKQAMYDQAIREGRMTAG